MLRWPGIRHIRWLWWKVQVSRHYERWHELGYLPVYVQHDLDHLDRIWAGLE